MLRPADVILVEGNQRISRVISYLTTSPWSHSALYLGDLAPRTAVEEAAARGGAGPHHLILEALAEGGVVISPLAKYESQLVRVCRPRLTPQDVRAVVAYAVGQAGKSYDVDNILDLMRYFLPAGVIPARFRRDALFFGAGKPTETICSSLIAAAFTSVGYPILPLAQLRERRSLQSRVMRRLFGNRFRRVRFRKTPVSLVVPRDFDLSPYFEVVKAEAAECADYSRLHWRSGITPR